MRTTLILAAGGLALSCAAAMAEARPTTAPNSAAPETFGDWILRCGDAPAGGQRACEVETFLTLPGQKQPIAQVAFGRSLRAPTDKGDAGAETTRLVVLIPVSVTIAPGIDVRADRASPPLTLPLKTCIPTTCFAQVELSGEQMQAFRNRSQPGEIVFTDPGGQAVSLALSFRGLDQALDSLAKH
jgi:invasion protein IalB